MDIGIIRRFKELGKLVKRFRLFLMVQAVIHGKMRNVIVLAAMLFFGGFLWGAEIKIVDEGKSDYVIVIPGKPSITETLAADELAKYIKRMSGAELKIQQGGTPADRSILISELDHLTQFGPVRFLHPDSPEFYSIGQAGQRAQIVGGNGRATLLAVYQLLEGMGCRFLAPEFDHYKGSGEVIPENKTLVVTAEMFATSAPKLKFRKLYVEEGHSHDTANLKQLVEWMAKVGFNTLVIPTNYQGGGRVKWDNWRKDLTPELQKRDIQIEVGGHGYQNFISADMEEGKLFEMHPDWFGADATGARLRAHGRVICTSNADAVGYLTKNVLGYLKDRPEIKIFDFWPPDGAKWCECEKCKALGTPSDRQAILVNHVNAKIKEAGLKVRVEMIAYAAALNPPEHAKLDKDVLVDFCPIGQQFDHQINDPIAQKNTEYASGLTAWRKAFGGDISIYSYYRKYAWDSLPVIIPHYMQKDLQWYASVPVQGISSYSEPGDWFTYELNHYTLAKLAWNPDADVDALVQGFCKARYGQSADLAQHALMTLAEYERSVSSIPNIILKTAGHIEIALGKIKTIRTQVQQDGALTKLALMLEYAQRDLEIQKLRATSADATKIQELGQELHDFLQAHADNGVFLVKDQRGAIGRLLNRYGIKAKREPGEGGRAAATRRAAAGGAQ
jgi:hypothetical protein